MDAAKANGHLFSKRVTATTHDKETLKAAKSGDVPALRKLISKDRSLLKVRDKDGSTPLHCAAWKGHLDAVKFLLEAGAGVNDSAPDDISACTKQNSLRCSKKMKEWKRFH